MNNLGYYNGKIGEIEKMSIPLQDRAFYFGDGVYDAVMCRNNIPYLLDIHIERIMKNASLLGIKSPVTKKQLADIIWELAKKVDGEEKFVYFQISRGSGIRRHEFTDGEGNLCIMIKPQRADDINKKMKTVTAVDKRYEYCHIKTLNLLPSVLAAQKAKENGCEETIFHRGGTVTECSHSNVSILKDGKLITAPANEHILPGVTRAKLIEAAKNERIEVCEREYTLTELYGADEIIVTSSSKLARGVSVIDERAVGGKDSKNLTLLSRAIYNDYIEKTTL